MYSIILSLVFAKFTYRMLWFVIQPPDLCVLSDLYPSYFKTTVLLAEPAWLLRTVMSRIRSMWRWQEASGGTGDFIPCIIEKEHTPTNIPCEDV